MAESDWVTISEPEFIQRMNRPDAPVIQNPDGSVSTHKMTWGYDDKGYYAFPTIVNQNNRLVELSMDEADRYAHRTGELKRFNTQAEAEGFAAGGWKDTSDEWETITTDESEWETIPEKAAPGMGVTGGVIRGWMKLGKAALDLPKQIVGHVKLPVMATMADEVLAAKDPKIRAARLADMAKVEGFFSRTALELGRAGEIHRKGQEAILKNHPEWESEPPKSFIDLVTSPDKLVVSLAESAPLLLSAGIMTAAGAPQVGVMMMYASEGQEAFDRAKAAGESDDVANDVYMVYGTVAAALEQMQLQGIMKISKGIWNQVLGRTAQKVARKGAKALTWEAIKVAGKEALEEMSQGEWGDITAKIIYDEPFGPVGAHIDRRAQEGYLGFAMGLLPAGATATAAKAQQKLRANLEAGKAVAPEVEVEEKAIEQLPEYKGEAWRVNWDYMIKTERGSAADVVRHEQESGNEWLQLSPKIMKQLENIPAEGIIWVTRTEELADELYGIGREKEMAKETEGYEIDETKKAGPVDIPEGSKVLYEFEDGVLVLRKPAPEVTGKKAAPEVIGKIIPKTEYLKTHPGFLAMADHQALVRESVQEGIIPYEGWEKDYKDMADAWEQHRAIQEIRGKPVPELKQAVAPEVEPTSEVADVITGTKEHYLSKALPEAMKDELKKVDTPEQITKIIIDYENAIATAVYGEGEDFLSCEETAQLLSDELVKRNIPHKWALGKSDEGSSHAWIIVNGKSYDPTHQGFMDDKYEISSIFEARPTEPITADEAIGKQYGLTPVETNERLGKAELRYRELKTKPVSERTNADKKELAFLKRNRKDIEAILERETRPIEKTMGRKKALALGHAIPKSLGWTEDQRKDFNKKITNQKSMKNMTPAQRHQIVIALTEEAKKAGIEVEGPEYTPVVELMLKLEERKQKPALTHRDRRNMKKLRKLYYRMKQGTNFYFLHMSRIKRFCRAMDNYETDGPFMRYIYQPVKDADTMAAVNADVVMDEAKRTFEKLDIDVVGMFSEVLDIGIDDKLSTAERIGVWALAQNKKTRNHLRSEFTEAEINTIAKSVEADEKEMLVAAEIQDYFETGWNQLQMIANAHGIKGIVKEENYITAFVKNKQDIGDTAFMDGLLQEFTQGKFIPGEQHTIERKPGAKRNLELNVFMIHSRASRAIERFKVMAPVADKVGEMLNNGGFKGGLNDTTYGHGSLLLDKWLQDSIRGRSTYDNTPIGQALRWLRIRSVHFVLGAKILTAAKQGISLVQAMGVHPGMIPLILSNLAHNPFGTAYKLMESETRTKSNMMLHRDWDRDLRQTFSPKAVKKKYAGKKLSPELMRMATWVDRHTATIVWYSAYQLAQKHGINEKESVQFADGVVEDTQPMGKAVDLPAYFRGGELAKSFSIFQNQVNQNGNMLWYDALGETKARKISPRMLGYRLLMQQVTPALLLGLVSRGRLPEDYKEIIKDMAFYLASPYFVVGRVAYNMFFAREWGPTSGFIWETPITETFRAVGAVIKDKPAGYSNWSRARQEEWDKKRIKDVAKYGARAVGAWTGGYPPLQVIQTVEGGWNLATGESDDFRELIWSKYALKKKGKKSGQSKEYYRY